ncbi:glycine receptor subunit alphaZ1 isoform X2 [Tetranychus urticae]|uniref:glycine receptor subunit alphaZ1 isoform X2 n=1 Tax=Tetranychus urticae TaxID=32264 RepID=UPI00077BDCF9|nr:glycine receptor subunit alphaZ1 isoform X2 [Tetranychus urticae]
MILDLFQLVTFILLYTSNCIWCGEVTSPLSEDWSFDQLIPKNYKKMRPPQVNGEAAQVNITLALKQLIAANEAEQVKYQYEYIKSITMDLFFYQRWVDHRIRLPQDLDSITLDSSWKSKLWIPNLHFVNSLSNTPVDLLSNPLYIELANGSHFTMATRVIVKLTCHMDLFNFPQDTQICNIDLACVDWSNRSVNFFLDKFTMDDLDDFPKFEITDYFIEKCSFYRGPDFPCIRVQLELFRRISYYAIRIYGPSCLLTLTSFVGFWIPALGYPARVAISVTPLLALVTQQMQINAEINVSYVVALHIWMMIQIFFVFMSLIEYVFAIVYVHLVEEKKEYLRSATYRLQCTADSNKVSHAIKLALNKIYGPVDWFKNPLDRNKIDYVARVLFPLTYILFLIIYASIFVFPWMFSKHPSQAKSKLSKPTEIANAINASRNYYKSYSFTNPFIKFKSP